MSDYSIKWLKRWTEFEGLRKGEMLMKTKIALYNDLKKTQTDFAEVIGEIDLMHDRVNDALHNRRGLTVDDAPLALKGFGSKVRVAKDKSPKAKAQAFVEGFTKDTYPKHYRAGKMLVPAIDEMVSLLEHSVAALAIEVKSKGMEQTREDSLERAHDLALASVKKGVARSLTEIQRCRAGPTLVGWDRLLNAGGTRDLYLALKNLVAAQQKGKFSGNIPHAGPYAAQMKPFNPGGTSATFGPEATDNDVPGRLKTLSSLVKSIMDVYSQHW